MNSKQFAERIAYIKKNTESVRPLAIVLNDNQKAAMEAFMPNPKASYPMFGRGSHLHHYHVVDVVNHIKSKKE